MMTWLDLINAASGAGYRTSFCEERGWIVITPKRPRRPSEELAGGFKDQQAALRCAALIHYLNP